MTKSRSSPPSPARSGASPAFNKDELQRLQSYLRKTLGSCDLTVRPRPKKTDSAEVYIGDEYIAILYKEEEDGEVSYQFQMAILDIDLEEG